ncbi:MAG: dUTP diphosphatase [Gemmatimonadales bacterium]|nr:dUTP diphosphatase [Gemmatimonadales bacterium]
MSGVLAVPCQRLPHGEGLPEPAAATTGSAGYDVCSADDLELHPGARGLVRTGFAFAVPEGFECQVRPRSGLALTHGVTLINPPATIDSDYRGELMIALVNLGDAPFRVTRGMRVAQLVFARHERVAFAAAAALPPSGRGTGGFGSTGR